MAARRDRNRRRRRRGRFGVLYKLLSILIIFAAILIGCVAFFRINTIDVTGNSRYTAQEIMEASGVEVGDNLFLINRPQTASNILRRLPYVETAVPVQHLPDRVELRITECVPVAALRIDGVWWRIDHRGKLLEQGDKSISTGLPVVSGLHPVPPTLGGRLAAEIEEQTKLEGLRSLRGALTQRGMAENVTDFIDLTSSGTIYFGYGNDLTVAVPVSGDFELRVFSLQAVMDTFAQRGERVAGTLDLTYGDDRARLLTERWLPKS